MAVRRAKMTTRASAPFNVAVDVGRSRVKIAVGNDRYSFPFLMASKKAPTADYYVPAEGIQKIAEVDGDYFLFGEEAMLLGDTVIQHTEGDAFRQSSITTTLFSIAYAMFAQEESATKVNLAINLTFDNHYQKEEYAEALKGRHKVFFSRYDEAFEFEVEKVFVLYQGFSGLLSVATDDQFKISKSYLQDGVIVDVGRQTIDFLYVERLVVKNGSSKDFGTFKVYERMVDLLKKKYHVVKEPWEIEELLSSGKPITSIKDGTKMQIAPLVREAVSFYFDDVISHFETFLSKKTPDYLILLGGGAMLYGDLFKERYKLVETPEDPQFSNAVGMLKFVTHQMSKA
jgi:hypothetical protein